METTFTVIERDVTPLDDEHGPWTTEFTMKTLVQGALADKIRVRAGAGPHEVVCLIEEATDASYSEYTRDSDYEFTLLVGDKQVDFHEHESYVYDARSGIGALMSWLNEDREAPENKGIADTFNAISPV